MSADGRWRTDTWLDQRLEQLNALYQRFGREGLNEFKDAHLLLWWKQMELRHGKRGLIDEQKRRLELEIKDLAGFVKGRENANNQGERLEQQQQRRGRGR